jgi:hypothetical protein
MFTKERQAGRGGWPYHGQDSAPRVLEEESLVLKILSIEPAISPEAFLELIVPSY